jgi:hypothetical protein
MLPNDTSRMTFNAISHKYYAQTANCKPSLVYSTLHFTYIHQNIINTYRSDKTRRKKNCSLIRDQLHNSRSYNVLMFENPMLRWPEIIIITMINLTLPNSLREREREGYMGPGHLSKHSFTMIRIWRPGNQGSIPWRRRQTFFSFPHQPVRLWVSHSLLSNREHGPFLRK